MCFGQEDCAMTPAQHETKTRLLDAALGVIRTKGYAATRVEDVCEAAGVTKGGFFHHFRSKEDLAVSAARHWSEVTGAFFAQAPYHQLQDPLDRLFGYLDFRKAILAGPLPEFTCLAGTMLQEVYATSPAIREACDASISGHATEVARDIALAKQRHAPDADFDPAGLALHTQAVLQGAFILAKARQGPDIAAETVDHLKRYIGFLFNRDSNGRMRDDHTTV
jgi:TetR/AcrR family transcriptional repressor of nem operon